MERVQVLLESDLLRSADRAAEKMKINRSELFRQALLWYLKRLETLDKEATDRDGYARFPDSLGDPAG